LNGGLICSVCGEEFDEKLEKYFDIEQKKCILHCEKKENDWYVISSNGEKDWNEKKVDQFWHYIRYELYNTSRSYSLEKAYKEVVFPAFQYPSEYDFSVNFYSNIMYDMEANSPFRS
jgi:hypothetical protein